MAPDERIRQRLDELLAEGDRIGRAEHRFTGMPGSIVDHAAFMQWNLSCRRLAAQIAPKGSDYYHTLKENAKDNQGANFRASYGALKALHDDFTKGWLRDLRELAAAEVFGDLLEMAEHLQQKGYHHGAVSLAGAVLEDCLRRVHRKHIGDWEGDSGISKLSTNLYKHAKEHDPAFYPNTRHSQVEAWAKFRNEVDHGRLAEVEPGEAKRMVEGVRDFVLKYEE